MAWLASIQVETNDRITKSRDLADILKNDIRGAEKTDIHLRIWRPSLKKRLRIKLTRVPMIY